MLMWGINPTLTGKAYPPHCGTGADLEFCFPVSMCIVNVSAINIYCVLYSLSVICICTAL